MIGGVTCHTFPHPSGVPHLHVNRLLNDKIKTDNVTRGTRKMDGVVMSGSGANGLIQAGTP